MKLHIKAGLKKKSNPEVIERLGEIRDEVIELMDEARRLIRGTNEEARFKGYVYGHVLSSMGHESYPEHSPTLESIMQSLEHPEEH